MSEKIIIITIQGLIGSGKSTLLQLFSSLTNLYPDYQIFFVEESINSWTNPNIVPQEYHSMIDSCTNLIYPSYLDLLYKNGTTFAFQFELNALLSIYKNFLHYISLARESKKPTIIIFERSIDSNKKIFVNALVKNNVFPIDSLSIYNSFYELFSKQFNQYEKIILHLNVDEQTCIERIKKRGRKEESTISIEYLQLLLYFEKEMIVQFKQNDGLIFELDNHDFSTIENKRHIFDQMILSCKIIFNK